MEYTVTVKYKGLYPDNKLESRMNAAVGKNYENHGCYIDDQIRDVDWFFPTQTDAFAAATVLGQFPEVIDVQLGNVEDGELLPKLP